MEVFLDNIRGLIYKIFGSRKKEIIIEAPFYSKDFFNNTAYVFGEYTYGKPKILDWGEGAHLTVGKFCSIAENVHIFLGGNHRTDWITTYPFSALIDEFPEAKHIKGHPATKGDVTIGNDVWIGYGAVILSGITIGDGAVIGAFSVVTKNVYPYEIVAGNPAKVIKKRFNDEAISYLLEIAWWNWPINKISSEVNFLCNDEVLEFIIRNKSNN